MGDALEQLAERMIDGKTVGFIGAGASVRCGYPLWADLLDGLYDQADKTSRRPLERRGDDDDLRWLAEYYSAALRDKVELTDAVQAVFDGRELTGPDDFHRLLVRLPFDQFVTTNYDDLLEDACNAQLESRLNRDLELQEKTPTLSGREDKDFSRFLRSLAEGKAQRSVLHLHGNLRVGGITLALSDYSGQYMAAAMPDRIYTIFATSTVVFIGTSLTDADIMSLVLRSTFHSDRKARHFAFLQSGYERFDDVLIRNYGIEPIRYQVPAHDAGDHSDLDRKLLRLLELVGAERMRRQRRAPPPLAPDLSRVKGNAQPVAAVSEHETFLEHIKDTMRTAKQGMVTFSCPDKLIASRVLRRIASDYASLPADYRFRRVVWLSPKRLGIFPDHEPLRSTLDAIMGETTRALGHHSVTATLDHESNIRAFRHLLSADGGRDASDGGEVTLFVVDDAPTIYRPVRRDLRQRELLNTVIANLPRESLVVRQYPENARQKLRRRKWRHIWHHVPESVAPPSATSDLDTALDRLAQLDHTALCVLAALSILAAPATSQQLTGMIGLAPVDIDRAVSALLGTAGDEPLIEPERQPGAPEGVDEAPAGDFGALDVAAPIRWKLLETVAQLPATPNGEEPAWARSFAWALDETIVNMFDWAAKTTFNLQDWEHDLEQSRRLNIVLPNLLTCFEATRWLAHRGGKGVATADRVRLGIQLAYILFNTGRWGEAKSYTADLAELAKQQDDPALQAEVQILRSRMLAFLKDGRTAMAAVSRDEDFPELQPDNPEHTRLEMRASIRRGVIHCRNGDVADAERELTVAYDWAWPKDEQSRPAATLPNEILAIQAESAEWLVEAGRKRLAQTPDRDRPELVGELLCKLDLRRVALGKREDRRQIGHHWRLRGQVLLDSGHVDVARRYFARALLVAFEFRDRLLEAEARLGLASCDLDKTQAEIAADIFAALGVDQRNEALDTALRVPEPAERGKLRPFGTPTIVACAGAPGSGRQTALRTAAETLTGWGLDPYPVQIGTNEPRRGDDGQPDRELDQITCTMWDDPVKVGTLNDTGRPAVLCIHIDPVPRPDHHNWVKPTEWSPPEPDWRERKPSVGTVLELDDIAYVSINSNVPILEFQAEVLDALAYSFLSVARLLEYRRAAWA